MRPAAIDEFDVIRIVNRAVDAAGGEAAFARQVQVSRQFVNQVRNGEKQAPDRVLAAAGIRRVQRFELIGQEDSDVG